MMTEQNFLDFVRKQARDGLQLWDLEQEWSATGSTLYQMGS